MVRIPYKIRLSSEQPREPFWKSPASVAGTASQCIACLLNEAFQTLGSIPSCKEGRGIFQARKEIKESRVQQIVPEFGVPRTHAENLNGRGVCEDMGEATAGEWGSMPGRRHHEWEHCAAAM